MEVCLEVLLELDFCTKPPNFLVEIHMHAPTRVALIHSFRISTDDGLDYSKRNGH
jgi:hypothetical protein